MKSFLFPAPLLVIFGLTAYAAKEYFYINVSKTWNDAQMYCRTEYTDLAVLTTQQENQQTMAFLSSDVAAWIGLKRRGGQTIWKWTDGTPASYTAWSPTQPNYNVKQDACVNTALSVWSDQACSMTLDFLCYRFFTLVKERMMWDEALTYCRSNFTEMASLPSQSQLDFSGTVVKQFQIQLGSVWTGLHFKDGRWFWLNRMSVQQNVGPLSTCPTPPYHCGARNFNTGKWEVRDCNDKLYFFCF